MASLYKGANTEAREFFKRAIQLDPEYSAAYAMAAWTLLREQSERGKLSAARHVEAVNLADEALRLNSDDAFAMARAGHVLSYIGHQYDRAASTIEEAILLNPNLSSAWFSRGFVALMCGEGERASDSFDMMLRLSPLDPLRTSAWYGKSFALFHLSRYDEGLLYARKSLQFITTVHALSAAILNCVGADRLEEAKQRVAHLLRLQSDFTIAHATQTFPTSSEAYRAKMNSAFQQAGLPAGRRIR
jgi:adenylate cyclase